MADGLATLQAWVVCAGSTLSCCCSLVCVCVCVSMGSVAAAARLLSAPFFFFFFLHRICLWLIMNKNDDMIFLYSSWKSTKAGWGKRGIEGEKGEECNKLKQNKLRLTCLWHTLWIQTLRLWWYSGMPSIWLSTGCFQGYFCWELSHGAVKIVKKKNWHMNTHTGHASRVASLVGLLFSKFYSVTTFFFFATGGCVSVWLLCLHALWSALLEHKRTTGNDWGCCSAWIGVNEALCLFFIYCYPIVSFQCI